MKVKFSRCNSNNLADVPQVDGQLIYVKDTHEVYMDVGETRNNITNFISKTNTTEFIPTADYHPATKKYVDDNCIPYQPFPEGLDTSHTTLDFITSIRALNLPAGSTYLGGVTLTDMPFNGNAEVEIYVYPNNVIYLTLRSANISPYIWECNSHTYRGWEAVGKAYADNNFLKKDNTVAYTPTGDYNPTTKKYVDDVATEIESTVEGLVDNQISEPINGTNIDLQDSANSEVKSIDIFGNSAQETRSGKNRIKLIAGGSDERNGITAIVNNDLSITLNGTATQDTNINFSRLGATIDNNVISGNTLSVFFVSGTWTTSNPTKSAFRIYNSDFSLALIVNQLNTLNNNNKVRYSTYQNNDLQVSNWNTNFLIPEGDTLDNFTVKLMLTDEVDTEYEDYGAMPSPDYPSEIKSTGDNGSITEKITNKNLVDFTNMNSSSSTTFTFIDNVLTVSSEEGQYNSANIEITNLIKSNKGKILSFGYDDIVEVGSVIKSFQLVITNQQNISSYYGFQTHNYKYNIPNDISDIKRVSFRILQNNTPNDNAGTLIIEKPILYFGEVKPEYAEHQEQLYTIPCQQPMRAIGDVKDTFIKVNGVWYERHYINRLILRGNQNWWASSSQVVNRYYMNLSDGKILDDYRPQVSYCNYYHYDYNSGEVGAFYLGSYQDTTRMFINYAEKDTSTIQDFKDFLEEKFTQGKPVYADYTLKEPLDLPCTQAQITALENLQKARTYKNVTHIFSEDEVPAEVNLIYYLDNEIVYKNILTNYVKNTDYAKGDVGGLIKTGNGFSATSNGYLTTSSYTYPEYTTRTNAIFIGKGTLETVINNSILKTGSIAPTTSTVGYRVGQLYLNTADNKVYQLTSIDDTDPNAIVYNWQQLITSADLSSSSTSFDNTGTDMSSTNVEDAIKELDTKIGDVGSALDSLNGEVI